MTTTYDYGSRLPPSRPASSHYHVTNTADIKDLDIADSIHRRPLEAINGHQLMSIFPAQRPDSHPEMRPGPTSGYFERQERAFFAHGNEIRSVQLHYETKGGDVRHGLSLKEFEDRAAKTHWPPPPSPSHLDRPPRVDSPTPLFYPHPGARGPGDRPPPPPVPPPHHSPELHRSPPRNAYPPVHRHARTASGTHRSSPPASSPYPTAASASAVTTPSGSSSGRMRHASPPGSGRSSDEYGDEDESWKRPTPYHERRRAGKHTKRVVVR